MKANHLISVIMPVYNAEKFILSSIKSILNQTYKHFELIIIDDGSSDKTCSIVETIKDSRIKLYKQDNRGVTISLNKGISLANGNIIARQDSDDCSHPERFKKQMEFFNINHNVGLIGTFSKLIDINGNFVKELSFPYKNFDLKKIIHSINPFIHGSIMMKKNILEKVGLYREQFLLAQSYDLWLRISEVAEISLIPEYLYDYRMWDNSVSYEKAALFEYFSKIAVDLSLQRIKSGNDILATGNNFEFYRLYGKNIVDKFFEKKTFRWL